MPKRARAQTALTTVENHPTEPEQPTEQPTELQRTYIVLSRAWYGDAALESRRTQQITDEITLIVHTATDALETHIEWHDLGRSGSHPQFTAFGLELLMLPLLTGVFVEWAALEKQRDRAAFFHPHSDPVTVDDLSAILDKRGWTNVTPLAPTNASTTVVEPDHAVRRTDADIEKQADKVKAWMWNAVTLPGFTGVNYIGAGQEVQTTQLAEDAARTFSLYYDDIECEIPDIVFDWSADTASAYETRRDNDGEDS